MNKKDFEKLAEEGFNHVPLVLECFADLDTPLSIYLKYANKPFSYLLESVQGGEQFGRYSFVGLPSRIRYEVRGHTCVEICDDAVVAQVEQEDPIGWVSELQQRTKAYYRDDLPRFLGGLVGYFGYETVHMIESRVGRGKSKSDPIDCPDILLLQSEEVIVYDNLAGKLYFVVFANPQDTDAYERGQARLTELFAALRKPIDEPEEGVHELAVPHEETPQDVFTESVARAKAYIHEGDIMQVVLSQRMSVPFHAPPLSLYRSLRALNPSPYMFYFNLEDFHIVGASPEILVRLEKGVVTLRPIAGTRPRGATRDEDVAYENDLLSDPKEIAEHVMLMDLGRNDVGRVAQVGSVSVTDQMVIERYSHVMHIVSNVEGRLLDGLSAIDVLRASFPAGTVSGAPKVRAMEIIDELEPSKRGVYAGAVGYLGFNGDMDVAIAIRTAVIKGSTLYVQAGAGIVADSVPENEWVETKNKAKAILRAAEIAEAGINR
ncbi:MAG: anthranilate synthase component I [Betaproteobacteria bacterium]|nr:anthranilate synthase component I [Betaproteobacteria bacterium]MDG1143112.1 anthranilate synthase component I [Burkholderiales bacterium]